MGYNTDLVGKFTFVGKQPSKEQRAYLRAFNVARHMDRKEDLLEDRSDPVREAVGLPVGEMGCFFVAEPEPGYGEESVIDYNYTSATPGLWCPWTVFIDGAGVVTLEWDIQEKPHDYVEWVQWLIDNLIAPWGLTLSGEVEWSGEDPDDRGIIRVEDNKVSVGYAKVTFEFE